MTLQACPRCPEMHRRAQAAESETAAVRKHWAPYSANIQRHCDEKEALRRENLALRAELAKVCDDIADVRGGTSSFDDGFRMGARTCAAALHGSPMRPRTDACDECRFIGEHSDHCSKSTR